MPIGYPPETILKGIGPNNLKKKKIVSQHKKGYYYTDPLNKTDGGKKYDSADSIDPWFDKNWVVDPNETQPEGVPNYMPPPPATVGMGGGPVDVMFKGDKMGIRTEIVKEEEK